MTSLSEKNLKNKILVAIFFLYGISIFTSKFGISLFGGSLALISIFSFTKMREEFIIEKSIDYKNILYLSFFIFVLGIIFQYFSLGGIKSSSVFFYRTYFLLILPFTIYFLNKYNFIKYLFKIMELALFMAILKSFYNFYYVYNLKYEYWIRVTSFFDIMRWGIVLVIGLLFVLARLDINLKKENIFSWIVFFSGIISLVLNNSRGPFLSFILASLFYVIISKKFKVGLSILLISAFLSFGVSKYNSNIIKNFITRIVSINESKHGGNAARIFMWNESLNFMTQASKNNKKLFLFGTGLDSSRMKRRSEVFQNYLQNKKEYENLSEDVKRGVSFMDAHNCYLNRYLETGVLYTFIYYLSLLFIIFKVFKNYIATKNNYVLASLSVVLAYAFCGIFYGYPAPYETFTFMFLLSLGLIKNNLEK
ncbi:MAG: O-antigen ligase family protein [Fusobacterium sp.]|nr:O-antigen ligase family protein [Fusobacterium sp.]